MTRHCGSACAVLASIVASVQLEGLSQAQSGPSSGPMDSAPSASWMSRPFGMSLTGEYFLFSGCPGTISLHSGDFGSWLMEDAWHGPTYPVLLGPGTSSGGAIVAMRVKNGPPTIQEYDSVGGFQTLSTPTPSPTELGDDLFTCGAGDAFLYLDGNGYAYSSPTTPGVPTTLGSPQFNEVPTVRAGATGGAYAAGTDTFAVYVNDDICSSTPWTKIAELSPTSPPPFDKFQPITVGGAMDGGKFYMIASDIYSGAYSVFEAWRAGPGHWEWFDHSANTPGAAPNDPLPTRPLALRDGVVAVLATESGDVVVHTLEWNFSVGGWEWRNHGRPSDGSTTEDIDVSTIGGVFLGIPVDAMTGVYGAKRIAVRTTQGNIWMLRDDGCSGTPCWFWENHGRPCP